MTQTPAIYIYDPDGNEASHHLTTGEWLHVPREGELVYASDHTDGGYEVYDRDEMWRVTEVQTEFRLVDNLGRGQRWQQLVYVRTEENTE